MSSKIVSLKGTPIPEQNPVAEHLRGAVDEIIHDKSGLAGFFIIGIDKDGRYRAGWHMGESLMFGSATLFTAYVREAVTREVITDPAITDQLTKRGL